MNESFVDGFRHYQTFGNWFLNFHPLTKLNILFSAGIVALVIRHWQVGLAVCVAICMLAVAAGKAKPYFKVFGPLVVVLGLFTMALRQVSVQGHTVLFRLFGVFNITQEALMVGLTTALAVLGFSAGIVLFFVATPMRDLMLSLEKLGVSHTISYIILASFQTMKDLNKSMTAIMESQMARGIETKGSIIVRLKAFFPILGPLVLGAISSTEEKSIAMDARAFSAKGAHTWLRELPPVPTAEKALNVVVGLGFIAAMVWRVSRLFV